MKKNLLFTLLALLVSTFAATAGTVRIEVDNASNVKVVTKNGGDGSRTLDLLDGMNTFTDLTSADTPLVISPANGATLVDVVKNGESLKSLFVNGESRFKVEDSGMYIQITTENASAPKDVVIAGIVVNGAGQEAVTLTYEKDNEWLAPELEYGWPKFPENSTVKITPEAVYDITGVTLRDGTPVAITPGEDGSVTFVCAASLEYQNLYVYLAPKAGAISFSIKVDNASHLAAYFRNGDPNNDAASSRLLTLKDGNNDIVCMPEYAPLEFVAADGASIQSVTLDGVECSLSNVGDRQAWMFNPEKDNVFAVTTLGKPVSVKLVANGAPLQSYFYKDSAGNVYAPRGTEDTIDTYSGMQIDVTPRPGTVISYLFTENGGSTDMLGWFKAAEGRDGQNPMTVQVNGSRENTTGVIINLDDASRVKILQAAGRGDELTGLQNGKNVLELTDFENSLMFSATEGNQMVKVSVDGDDVPVNAQGAYVVAAEAGNWIDVVTRKSPVNVAISFGETDPASLVATVNGTETVLTEPFNVRTYDELVLSAAPGYVLSGVSAMGNGGVTVEQLETKAFKVVVNDASLTQVTLSVIVTEKQPAEGNSIVIPNGNPNAMMFVECTGMDLDTRVKTLAANAVEEVKTGNYVMIWIKSPNVFSSVKLNGEPLELTDSQRMFVKIEGRSVIDVETYVPREAYTEATIDEEKHVEAGMVYMLDGTEKVTRLYDVKAGQTIKLVAEPSKGYKFEYFELFKVGVIDSEGLRIDGDSYTVTVADMAGEQLLFKGVFSIDENAKSYKVCGTTAWLADDNGGFDPNTLQAMGSVLITDKAGAQVSSYLGFEDEVVNLNVGTDIEGFQSSDVLGFYFMDGFPNKKIEGWSYTIKASDANEAGEIWISALVRNIYSGISDVEAAEGLSYNSATATLSGAEGIKVFDMQGKLLLSGNGSTLGVETLPAGIYVAVSGGKTLKFVR